MTLNCAAVPVQTNLTAACRRSQEVVFGLDALATALAKRASSSCWARLAGHGLHLPATRAELRTRKIHSDGILDKRCPVAASAAPDLYRITHFGVAHFEHRAFATVQWSSPPGSRVWHSPPALHSQSTRLLGHDSAIGNRNVDARAVRLPHVSNEQGSRQEKCRAAQRSAAHSSPSTTVLKNKALFAYLQVACEECDGNLNGTV